MKPYHVQELVAMTNYRRVARAFHCAPVDQRPKLRPKLNEAHAKLRAVEKSRRWQRV